MLDLPSLAFGCASKNDLRSLGSSSQWGDVSDTSALNSQEREEKCQEDGEQRHANWHIELHAHDNASQNDDGDEWEQPHPPLDEFLVLSKVLDKVSLLLSTLLLKVWARATAHCLACAVQARAGTTIDSLGNVKEHLVLKAKLHKGDDNHEQDTRPEQPETRGGVIFV